MVDVLKRDKCEEMRLKQYEEPWFARRYELNRELWADVKDAYNEMRQRRVTDKVG